MNKKTRTLLTILLSGFMLAGCGQQGPKGDKGDQGAPGEKGDKGDEGLTPTVSINDQNHWVINGVDTGVSATGSAGETPTISISDDGYWVINGAKTSTLAKGTNGNNGTNGKDGVSIVKIEKTKTEGSFDTYTITFSNETSQTFNVTNGTDGKSAYELYCAQYDYKGSLEDWLEKFYSEDTTDYSKYSDFEFTPITYSGIKGYSASYIGTGGDVVVPETFNCEPVLGFKFGFNDMHEVLEEDPGYKIDSVYISKNVQFVALNGNSEYALHCINNTVFTFTASLKEVIYSNFIFDEICFDGSFEALEETNLISKFPISNIYAKDSGGEYFLAVDNFNQFEDKYNTICNKVEKLQLLYLPDMLTKFDDGEIEIPSYIEYMSEAGTTQVPVTVVVNDDTNACYAYQNKIHYAASKIEQSKGKEVFLVEFVFELAGEKCVGASSTVIISKAPNLFKTAEHSFPMKEYDEIYEQDEGLYSQTLTINFSKGVNEIKAYCSDEYGVHETAMPNLDKDEDSGLSGNITYDSDKKCLNCAEAGEYSFGISFNKKDNKYLIRGKMLDAIDEKIHQLIIEFLQSNYDCVHNQVYVKAGDVITITSNLDFYFKKVHYTASVEMRQMPGHPNMEIEGNKATIKLEEDEDSAFASWTYTATTDSDPVHICTRIIGFKITK